MTGMPTRPLGSTGMRITTVGLGAWAIGGGDWAFGWGPQDDADSVRTIHHAVEHGINWIDTAAVYGLGHSERIVGRALRELPEADRPFVFTKCGMVWDDADRARPPAKIGRAASLRAECDASLRRLGVERIDLLQLHWPPKDGTEPEEYWGTLLELKREGKIRAVGVSNVRLPLLEKLESIGHIDSLQPPLSLINQRATEDLLPWCAEHGIGAITYSPLQSGLLTGHWTRERAAALPPDDWRRTSPDFTTNLDDNLVLIDRLAPLAWRHGTTFAAVAIAWVLRQPGVTGAIVGARTPDQLADWIDAGELTLDDSDLDTLLETV